MYEIVPAGDFQSVLARKIAFRCEGMSLGNALAFDQLGTIVSGLMP